MGTNDDNLVLFNDTLILCLFVDYIILFFIAITLLNGLHYLFHKANFCP